MGKGGQRPAVAEKSRDDAETKLYSWAEITKHRTPADAWIVVHNKVYDISGWHAHPGGDVCFTSAGDDATDTFYMFHAQSTKGWLPRFYIGDLDPTSKKQWSNQKPKSDEQLDFEEGYRALNAEMRRMGLFDSSPLFYAYKMATTLLIAVSSWAAIATYTGDTWAHFAVRVFAAAWLGIFFQQCGWLCHEVLHHQVFKNRKTGRMVGYFWGNVCQGFSCSWWTNKHNTHHSVPNVHATGADEQNGDPDIDTMPFLAWSRPMLKLATSALSRFMVSHQNIMYFPLLALARVVWLQQSVAYVLNLDETAGRAVKGAPGELKPVPHEKLELAALALHYVWYFAIASFLPNWREKLLYVLVSNVSCGLGLALVFGLGHNGMAVYDARNRPDYWKLQVTTTRNISHDRFGFVHWFCGGLDYQVEHHLFPTVPRHHLKKVNELTMAFCAARGVTYHEASLVDGTVEVLKHLKDIAEEFVSEFPAM